MFKAASLVLVTRMTPICEKLWIFSLQQAAGVTFQEELSRGLLSATGLDLGVQVLAVGAAVVSLLEEIGGCPVLVIDSSTLFWTVSSAQQSSHCTKLSPIRKMQEYFKKEAKCCTGSDEKRIDEKVDNNRKTKNNKIEGE